jgi:hypothetical protein
MLEGRSMYVWRLAKALGSASVASFVQKAKEHSLSSLWVKIADGDSGFANVKPPWKAKFVELVSKAHAAQITVYGYHVPHCANATAVVAEAQTIAGFLDDFSLDGVVIDNEEGAAYFRGGANEARAYGRGLQQALRPAGRSMVMSSHDVVSAHPKAYAKEIAPFIDVNAPQVYYGQSSSVQARLDRAIVETAQFPVPFVPVGALFIREPGENDGGCANEDQCAQRARDFITLVSQRRQADPQKIPGYGFWNWEEAPPKAWDVLKTMPVFV